MLQLLVMSLCFLKLSRFLSQSIKVFLPSFPVCCLFLSFRLFESSFILFPMDYIFSANVFRSFPFFLLRTPSWSFSIRIRIYFVFPPFLSFFLSVHCSIVKFYSFLVFALLFSCLVKTCIISIIFFIVFLTSCSLQDKTAIR